MHWYLRVLKKYAVFSGRARRMEYWMFLLVHIVICIVIGLIETMVHGAPKGDQFTIGAFYVVATILPIMAVGVRRLHDTGRSGWWYLILFVPIGAIVLVWFIVQDSNPGENQFGPNPKLAGTA